MFKVQYAGLIILFAGAFLSIQLLLHKEGKNKDIVIFQNKREGLVKAKKNYLYCYAITLIISGLTTICLDNKFFMYMNYFYKLPVYTLISKIKNYKVSALM